MNFILATKSSAPILGQIAYVLGWIMDGIYKILDGLFGIENIGLCIIIFTFLMYLCMTPLQIKQQKFSKLSAAMNPELQAIQKKYKNKKDNVSMQKMQEETSLVYQKYGVSPTGSCLQLVIQMPILLALYQVIYRIPGYIGSVKAVFTNVVGSITGVNGYTDIIQSFIDDNKIKNVTLQLENGKATSDSVIDVLYKLSPSQWEKFSDIKQFSTFSGSIDSTATKIAHMQNFGPLNIADNPFQIIQAAFAAGAIITVICAVLIPFLAWFTQWMNYKLMPQMQQNKEAEPNQMANTMQSMNTFMPIMSAVFCFTFPVGIGIYWIAGAVIRSIQQLVINRHMSKIDMNDLIKANMEKANKKREKKGLPPQKITNQAHVNTRSVKSAADTKNSTNKNTERAKQSTVVTNSNAKPGSIASKANMVKQFDENNKKK